MQCIYYSLVTDERAAHQRRWTHSVRSLRQFNPAIPVYLFVFNRVSDSLRETADRFAVSVRDCGDYGDFLSEFGGRDAAGLNCMPTLQKLLPLQFSETNASRILYLDCDTFFFGDVESLFTNYKDCDWYAREEPLSRTSVLFPYDPRHIDEDELLRLNMALGAEPIPPRNLGVFLFNPLVRQTLLDRRTDFFDLIWRFATGVGADVDAMPSTLKKRAAKWTAGSGKEPLTFPSQNFWIVDQIALWLTLGTNADLSHGLFAAEDVLQGPEFLLYPSQPQRCTVAHYYSHLETQFFSQLHVHPSAAEE